MRVSNNIKNAIDRSARLNTEFNFDRAIADSIHHKVPGGRSRSRHQLIDYAINHGTDEDWKRIGAELLRASDSDDLTPQVSDRFVQYCPDSAFQSFARQTENFRFRRWRDRSRTLLGRSG